MAAANNADDYASSRINIFFPGIEPSLDGQCVSLAKWFMAEMTNVPNPQAARGDARYVGKTLVAQGHAVEVPYDQRKRGDLVCYETGQYGHIGVILSGNRTFEENVNWPGTSAKIVDGSYVYASRIGSMAEPWRQAMNMHIYRLNTYREGASVIEPQTIISTFADFDAGTPTPDQIKYYGNHPNGYDELHTDLLKYNFAARKDLEKKLAEAGSGNINKAAVLAYLANNLK